MQSINIAFSTTNGLFSRLIRWFTKSEVSHSIITFKDETLDKVFVMEANGRGFMLVPWSKWRTQNTLIARYRITAPSDVQLESLRELAESLGAEYDYMSLFAFVIRRFHRRMQNPLDDSSKLICSEAVARFLHGVMGGDSFIDSGSWTPEDLLAEIRASGIFVPEELG
jgi:hypothetical protein